MLCHACENIFRDHFHSLHNCSEYLATLQRTASFFGGTGFTSKPNYRAHQPDFSTLYQSALKECWICMQIFEDVCKKYMEEHPFRQNSTLAEITQRILEATTEVEKTDFISGNFTVYLLTENKRVNGSDMTLCIRVESMHLPRSCSYEYNLADQRETAEVQNCSPENSVSRFIDSDWPLYHARTWLETCTSKHSRCSQKISGWLPTRLLDLGESTNGIIRLVETKHSGAIENMTLSYCWGKADIYTLTSETARPLLGGLKISLLPRTFQRTIQVARYLGTKFLWIDSLCIMQDSVEDWERESVQIGKVYSNSLFTIAATSSTDGEGGLFGERPSKLPLESTDCYISSSWTDHSNSIPDLWTRPTDGTFFKKNIPDLFIMDCPNLGAGTTANSDPVNGSIMQTAPDAAASLRPSTLEGYPMASTASTPSAVFQRLATEFWTASPSQARIFWEGIVSQVEMDILADGIDSQMQLIDFWEYIVSIYSRCDLTFEKDKLVALSGVARAMKVPMGCEYLAGMWRTELERNLLWSVDNKFRRPREYRAPSWSWASVDGGINIPKRSSDAKDEFEIDVLCVSTQKKSADEMGQVLGGALKVRGPLMTCFVQRTEDFEGNLPREYVDHYDPEIDSDDPPACFFRINGVWDDGSPSMDAGEALDTSSKRRLHCLPILQEKGMLYDDSYNCLVLEHTEQRGVFKRCRTLRVRAMWHDIAAKKGWIMENPLNNGGEVILNEEWFHGGEADIEGKYTITII
ncbi:HET-domain-containing protein [Cadophora sp. DSE1049]|nr:HET-domain-containing protein [Cadophora sp. DSE1049]